MIPEEVLKEALEESVRQKYPQNDLNLARYNEGKFPFFSWGLSSEKYGATYAERIKFWERVIILGDYEDFYKLLPKVQHQEITIGNETFMI